MTSLQLPLRVRSQVAALCLLLSSVFTQPVEAQVPEPPADALYAASSQGRVYYWVGCMQAWGRLKADNIVFFRTAQSAEDAGYVPSRQAGCGRESETVTTPAVAPDFCRVAAVIDGDTFSCDSGHRIRLVAIDAPEMEQQPYGHLARSALLTLLPIGDTVRLEFDVQVSDRYGRTLAYAYGKGGAMANLAMVRGGYAVVAVYPPNVRHVEALRRAAAQAREDSKGLWATKAFQCAPARYRRGDCVDDGGAFLN